MPHCPACGVACDEGTSRCPGDGHGTATNDPLLGQVLGERYRILTRIGAGGMGTVYRAEHIVLCKRVAVKVLRPELSLEEELVRRFQREAIAASQIGQENIVDVTDFGRTARGELYFVMEELDGESLRQILASCGPLPVDRALRILSQLCRALAAAHARGIVHRDLKPDNVVVVQRTDGSELVKVVDFGVSQSGPGGGGRITRAGMILGTPEYMAPEQGTSAMVDHRADVYGFGVLAYEMFTGKPPFHGETSLGTLLAHQTLLPQPPSRHRPDIPADVDVLIVRALAKRPDARQQTMLEMATELTRVLVARGLPAVYDRCSTPLPRAAETLANPTDRRFPPGAGSTGRGATVALDLLAHAGEEPVQTAAPALSRRSRRALVASALGLAAVLAAVALATRASRPPTLVACAPAPEAGLAASTTASMLASALAAEPIGAAHAVSFAAISPSPAPEAREVPSRTAAGVRRAAPERKLGGAARKNDNPYPKLDDLKPDPF